MKKNIIARCNAHSLFVVIALVFGLVFVFATPLLWGADETTQLGRAYQVSEGHVQPEFFGIFHGGGYGGQMPAAFIKLIDYVNNDITHPKPNALGIHQVNSTAAYKTLGAQKIGPATTPYVFSNTAPYSPLAYAPSAVGLDVGHLLQLRVGEAIHLARLFGLLVYVALIWFGLKVLQKSRVKWIIFTVALLPMSLFQASMITADSITIAMCLLLVALVLKGLFLAGPFRRADIIMLCLSVVTVPLLKPTYLPLIFLALLIPDAKLSIKSSLARLLKGAPILAGLLFFGLWSFETRHITDTLRLVIPGTVWSTINPSLQEHFLIRHPLSYMGAIVRTFILYDNAYFNQFFGLLGFNYIQIPAVSIAASFLSLIMALLVSENVREKLSKLKVASIFVVVLASVLFMLTTFYITLTSVGGGTIGGLQGRYFIPLAAPLLLGIALLLPKLRIAYTKVAYRQAASLLVALVVVSLTISMIKYYYFTF
ncbi:MAG TPA: DUF2142 domain-containing protein [Candidatus Saccharimonadales bacterium]|nr:DUF2142 domain-containing protein [Candidatus Saccharimonadales bacterium]